MQCELTHVACVPRAGTAEQFAAGSQIISICVYVCLHGHSLIIITTLEVHAMLEFHICLYKHSHGEKRCTKSVACMNSAVHPAHSFLQTNKLRGLSLQAIYTDRETAACRQS
jgi:hypothetical protein